MTPVTLKAADGAAPLVLPDEVLPDEVLPDEVLPDEVLPDEVLPGEVLPDEVLPDEVLPDEVLPGEVLPGDAVEPAAAPPPPLLESQPAAAAPRTSRVAAPHTGRDDRTNLRSTKKDLGVMVDHPCSVDLRARARGAKTLSPRRNDGYLSVSKTPPNGRPRADAARSPSGIDPPPAPGYAQPLFTGD